MTFQNLTTEVDTLKKITKFKIKFDIFTSGFIYIVPNHITGRPHLWYKNVCKRDLKALNMDHNTRESTARKLSAWRQTGQKGLLTRKETKRQRSRAQSQASKHASDFTSVRWGRD